MAKFTDDDILDAACNYVKNNVTEMYVCSSQPTSYAEASSTYKLAGKTGLTSDSFTGPANGDVSGRKMTKNAELGISVTGNGSATHLALCTGAKVLLVTTITSQVVTSGNTINTPAFDIEFADVTP